MMRGGVILLAGLLALAGCKEEQATLPAPVPMDEQALGYYCQMAMSEHEGPKAQVHTEGGLAPLFFSQVRDAIAFERMPEQEASVVAIYVNDMGQAASWAEPGVDNWVLARNAFFVVGSRAVGGMGASELVPFGTRDAAEAFVRDKGGRIVTYSEIRDADVFLPDDTADATPQESDFLERLNATKTQGNR